MRTSRIERELRWFYLDSDGELGLKTSFGSMVAGIMGLRGGSREADVDDRQLLAAERARKIFRNLERCSKQSRDVLRSAFGVVTQISTLGILSHVMILTSAFTRSWKKSQPKNRERFLLSLMHNQSTPESRIYASEIRREAEQLLHTAIQEYNLQEEGCSSGRLTQSQSWQRS